MSTNSNMRTLNTVLILGASRGIGFEFARQYVQEGWRVLATARNDEGCAKLQAIGADTNSNLILLPNSPQAGSDMLNNMVASFTASNQIGETMKNQPKRAKKKTDHTSADYNPSDTSEA